jgi:CelD/BcsL family acetyltransferase involved in cellulose biosynthesis
VKFDAVCILGGTPLLPPTSQFFDLLFEGIARTFPGCPAIELRGVPIDSPLWNYVNDHHPFADEYAVYAPDGPRNCHTFDIPDSFDAYLAGFKRKKRYNLRRQIRCLEQWSGGTLVLRRVESARDVADFRSACAEIARLRWGQRADDVMSLAEMVDLAERGLLLSYILQVRERPCALAFGTRFAHTLQVHGFAHDRAIERLSPGIVLQMLMMEDLISHRLARRIDYGFGEPKYRLTNSVDQRANVTLLPKNAWSRSAISAHASFVRLTDYARRLTRWREHDAPSVRSDDDARLAPPAVG